MLVDGIFMIVLASWPWTSHPLGRMECVWIAVGLAMGWVGVCISASVQQDNGAIASWSASTLRQAFRQARQGLKRVSHINICGGERCTTYCALIWSLSPEVAFPCTSDEFAHRVDRDHRCHTVFPHRPRMLWCNVCVFATYGNPRRVWAPHINAPQINIAQPAEMWHPHGCLKFRDGQYLLRSTYTYTGTEHMYSRLDGPPVPYRTTAAVAPPARPRWPPPPPPTARH